MADIADQVYLLSLKSQQAKESSFESNLTYLGNINERKITQFKETTVEGSHLRFQQAQTTTAKRWLSIAQIFSVVLGSAIFLSAAPVSVPASLAIGASAFWQISSVMLQALNVESNLLTALLPKVIANNLYVNFTIQAISKLLSVASFVILAIAGSSSLSNLAQPSPDLFKLAQKIALTGVPAALGLNVAISQSKADSYKGSVIRMKALQASTDDLAKQQQQLVESDSQELQRIAKTSAQNLQLDHEAKQSLVDNN